MKRIGIFGGAFSPVHHGHLLVARAALEALRLDQVVFVPCARSAYTKKLLPAKMRWRMLRAALPGSGSLVASDVELKRGGVSRSIDTLREFKSGAAPGTRYFVLIGADQVENFPHWKEALQLSKLSKICVLSRPGFRKLQVIHKKFRFATLDVPQYEISSTEIRHRVKKNMPIDWLVPAKVATILQGWRP